MPVARKTTQFMHSIATQPPNAAIKQGAPCGGDRTGVWQAWPTCLPRAVSECEPVREGAARAALPPWLPLLNEAPNRHDLVVGSILSEAKPQLHGFAMRSAFEPSIRRVFAPRQRTQCSRQLPGTWRTRTGATLQHLLRAAKLTSGTPDHHGPAPRLAHAVQMTGTRHARALRSDST